MTWVVQVVKTAGMDLTTRQGQVALLAAVVKRIDRLVSDERALQVAATVVDEAALVPPGQDPVEAVRARWDAVAVGDVVELAVGEDFLRVVAAYVDTSDWLQPDRGELRLGPPVDDGCWRPVLVPGGGTTVAERVAFALGLIRRAQEDDMRARAQGGAPLPRRYEVGAVYGGLVFVGHPYVGFLDDQLWLTPDGSLFWLNQRACSLEAFRAAVVRAAPTVRLAVAVSAVSALAAGALVAGPALAAAGPVLREAGYAAQAWVLANPITARQLFFVGVELTLAVAFNQDLPPISPADQLEFHVAGVLSDGTQAAIRYVTEVAGTPVAVSAGRVGKGVELRLLVHEIQVLIGRAAARVVRQRPTIVQLTRVPAALGGAVGAGTPPAALGAMAARPHLSARALTWMRAAGFSEAAVRRVLRAHRHGYALIRAANRFAGPHGFDRVLSEAVSGARWKEQGARFVIDFALDLLADADVAGRALYFEMRVGTGEEVRFVDLWFEGTRYELKSVRELHEYLVTGRAGALGQFQRDVTRLLGQSEETAFDNLARLKWVFDGRRLPPDVEEAFILAQLGDWLAANEPYRSWPRLSELLDALKGVVVVWP